MSKPCERRDRHDGLPAVHPTRRPLTYAPHFRAASHRRLRCVSDEHLVSAGASLLPCRIRVITPI